jgi:hypothetical protein
LFAVKQNQRLTVGIGNAFQRAPENRLFFFTDGLRRGRRIERGLLMNRFQ